MPFFHIREDGGNTALFFLREAGLTGKRLTAPAAYRYSFTPFFFRMMVLTVRTFTPYQSSEYPSL